MSEIEENQKPVEITFSFKTETIEIDDTEQFDRTEEIEVEELSEEGKPVAVMREVVVTDTRQIKVEKEITVYKPESKELSESEIEAFEASKVANVVPYVVTMKQARKALILGGISIASVDAAISAIEDDQERELAVTDWEYSQTVRRDSSLVVSMAAALGLTDAQVDGLFVSAALVAE